MRVLKCVSGPVPQYKQWRDKGSIHLSISLLWKLEFEAKSDVWDVLEVWPIETAKISVW